MSTTNELAVVVESRAESVLMERLLSRGPSLGACFLPAEGQGSLVTIARSIMVHEGGPLIVVTGAETSNPRFAAETRGLARFAIEQVAPDPTFDVFMFIPQVDVVFFEAPCILRRRFGAALTETALAVGRFDPLNTLESLLAPEGLTREEFYRALSDEDVDAVLAGPQASQFVAAVEALVGSASVVGSAA